MVLIGVIFVNFVVWRLVLVCVLCHLGVLGGMEIVDVDLKDIGMSVRGEILMHLGRWLRHCIVFYDDLVASYDLDMYASWYDAMATMWFGVFYFPVRNAMSNWAILCKSD